MVEHLRDAVQSCAGDVVSLGVGLETLGLQEH